MFFSGEHITENKVVFLFCLNYTNETNIIYSFSIVLDVKVIFFDQYDIFDLDKSLGFICEIRHDPK